MEKESQSNSITTLNIKSDYAPSEIYSSEPPPAYHRPESLILQVTKLITICVVLVSLIICSFLLASNYIVATMSCQQTRNGLENLHPTTNKLESSYSTAAFIKEKWPNQDTAASNQIGKSDYAATTSTKSPPKSRQSALENSNFHSVKKSFSKQNDDFMKDLSDKEKNRQEQNTIGDLKSDNYPDEQIIIIRDETGKQISLDENQNGQALKFPLEPFIKQLMQQSQPVPMQQTQPMLLETGNQDGFPITQILDSIMTKIVLPLSLEKHEIYGENTPMVPKLKRIYSERRSLPIQDNVYQKKSFSNEDVMVNNVPGLFEMHFVPPQMMASQNMPQTQPGSTSNA